MKKLYFFISFIALCTLPSPAWAHPNHRVDREEALRLSDTGIHEGNLIIVADNVRLDCDGLTVMGTGNGIGILLLERLNVVVEGCHVTDFRDGIVLRGSNNNVFRLNQVDHNTDDGFQLEQSAGNFFIQNKVTENNDDGFDLEGSGRNFFTANNVNKNGENGFTLDLFKNPLTPQTLPSNNNVFVQNNINDNGRSVVRSGISLENSIGNFFISNAADRNTRNGFRITDHSNKNTFINNRARRNTDFDCFQKGSSNNVFSSSRFGTVSNCPESVGPGD